MPAKKRKYVQQWPKGGDSGSMAVGIPENSKGFLCTCSGFEKEAVREVYRLLEEFTAEATSPEDDGDDGDGDDLEKELEQLREENKRGRKKFQQFKIKARGVIFVRISDQVKEEPEDILLKMLQEFEKSGEKQCRALSRVLPVQTTCKAFPEGVMKAVTEMITKKFANVEGAKTYSIQVNKRNNDNELLVVSKITQFVRENFPLFRTDPGNPNVMISIEVVAASCFLSIVDNYGKFGKFRLSSLGENAAKKTKSEGKMDGAG